MASNNNDPESRVLPAELPPQDAASAAVNESANAGIEPKSLVPAPRASAQPSSRTSAGTSSGPQSLKSLSVSRSPSAAASPWSSRDSSPAPTRKQSTVAATRGMRSRKNSHDVSPSRAQPAPISTVPSAAAIQRALSAASMPQLQPATTSDQLSRIPRTQKSNGSSMEGTLQWPVSPRLKSPPPSSGSRRNSRGSLKKPEQAPSIVVQGSTPSSSSEHALPLPEELQKATDKPTNVPPKAANRGASGVPKLETVQEAGLPAAPGPSVESVPHTSDARTSTTQTDDEQRALLSPEKPPRASSRALKGAESGSDSGGRSRDRKRDRSADLDATPRATRSIAPRSSQSSLRPKAPAETATKNMTVETETVNSVAQATLNPPDRSTSGRVEPSGTLKVKASNETIRPRKERKKAARKAPSVNAGTGMSTPMYSSSLQSQQASRSHGGRKLRRHQQRGIARISHTTRSRLPMTDGPSMNSAELCETRSAPPSPASLRFWLSPPWRHYPGDKANHRSREASSRADIFEGQVLDAMDQATSDDSDETFVYESNPPDAEPHRSRGRHHSRTPSATSMTSMADQRPGARSIAGVLDSQRPMQKSRSMKFASNAYGSGADDDAERQDGTVRASRNGGSSIHHHHHQPIGRHSRTSTGPTSILDDENPTFPALSKPRTLTGIPSRQAQTARAAPQQLRVGPAINKRENGYSSYDLDDEPADDERTPLVSNGRTSRNGVRTPRSARSRYPPNYPRHRRSLLSRFAGCIVLLVMLLLLAFGVVAFLFAISKPLTDVRIIEIEHVLASEQEIMLDLVVEAVNPNLLPINVADMDINIFARSKYVGSEKWWREHPDVPGSVEPSQAPKRRRRYRPNDALVHSDSLALDGISILDDDQTDPPNDPPKDGDQSGNKQTMLLGHVYKFDNPLSFDGSFWRRHPHYSTASLRLSKPGNKTELGGTERWERVLQHPFNLVVRGVLKYTIPLGGSKFSASINSETIVHPEKGIQNGVDDVDPISRLKGIPTKRDQLALRPHTPSYPCSKG